MHSSPESPLRQAELNAMKQQLISGLQNTSRDHLATLADEEMLKTMHASWPAWRQWFEQCQRDMSRFPKNEDDRTDLNMLHFTFSQIMSRTIEAIEQGDSLRGSE